jgi:NTP pyrophosphatase (non-canonical NTP hydrolase)
MKNDGRRNIPDIDEYAVLADGYAVYPEANTGSIHEAMYLALGLVGESGEVAGKIKKLYRDNRLVHEDLEKEIGDVFWYLTRLCAWLEVKPSTILEKNLKKLEDRKNRNVIKGNGDNR